MSVCVSPSLVYRRLLKAYGPQGWWPVTQPRDKESSYRPGFWGKLNECERLEICVGAILTQNTNWGNVVVSIARLHQAKIWSLQDLAKTPAPLLESLLRSSGYFRQKARKLKIFAEHILDLRLSLGAWFLRPLAQLREELIGIWGIGPETADSILLYAAQRPVFVIDAYTSRIARRIGWKHLPSSLAKRERAGPSTRKALRPGWVNYAELQNFFESRLPKESFLYAEFHALFVALAKRHCLVKPICLGCPISDVCAHGVRTARA
jgi:endonuclease-3 related protein